MRTTINIDDKLFAEASKVTGIKSKTALIHAGLQEILTTAAIKHLISLRGTMPDFQAAPRRKPANEFRATGPKRRRKAA